MWLEYASDSHVITISAIDVGFNLINNWICFYWCSICKSCIYELLCVKWLMISSQSRTNGFFCCCKWDCNSWSNRRDTHNGIYYILLYLYIVWLILPIRIVCHNLSPQCRAQYQLLRCCMRLRRIKNNTSAVLLVKTPSSDLKKNLIHIQNERMMVQNPKWRASHQNSWVCAIWSIIGKVEPTSWVVNISNRILLKAGFQIALRRGTLFLPNQNCPNLMKIKKERSTF